MFLEKKNIFPKSLWKKKHFLLLWTTERHIFASPSNPWITKERNNTLLRKKKNLSSCSFPCYEKKNVIPPLSLIMRKTNVPFYPTSAMEIDKIFPSPQEIPLSTDRHLSLPTSWRDGHTPYSWKEKTLFSHSLMGQSKKFVLVHLKQRKTQTIPTFHDEFKKTELPFFSQKNLSFHYS